MEGVVRERVAKASRCVAKLDAFLRRMRHGVNAVGRHSCLLGLRPGKQQHILVHRHEKNKKISKDH